MPETDEPGRLGPLGPATAMRTDHCGTLTAADVGRSVTLCGWVARQREHGEHLVFLDLRDHTGVLQCVVDRAAHDLRAEWVVQLNGTVHLRPAGAANPGIEERNVLLGCVQPGEAAPTFGDSLRRLTDAATFLYVDGKRYWYSTQPSVTRLAQESQELHVVFNNNRSHYAPTAALRFRKLVAQGG